MSSIVFTNPFDAITGDKNLATDLQMRAILLILLRDILGSRISKSLMNGDKRLSSKLNKTWKLEIIDPKDGSDDYMVVLPDHFLKELDLKIGDTVWVEIQDNQILLKKFGDLDLHLSDFIPHVIEAIERILQYTENMTQSAFLDNQLVQDAVIRNFEIIVEASRNIIKYYPEFIIHNLNIPWQDIVNLLPNDYLDVDLLVISKTIQDDLPHLLKMFKESSITITKKN